MPLLNWSYGAVLFVVVHRHHSRVGLLLVASLFCEACMVPFGTRIASPQAGDIQVEHYL